MSKINVNDPGQKEFDSTGNTKIYDSSGKVKDITAAKKSDISDLVGMLQSSVNSNLGSQVFSSKFDLAYQSIYNVKSYVNGLERAATAILEAYPDGSEENGYLGDLVDICRVLDTGCERVEEYLNAASVFGRDLDAMSIKLNTLTQKLFTGE